MRKEYKKMIICLIAVALPGAISHAKTLKIYKGYINGHSKNTAVN